MSDRDIALMAHLMRRAGFGATRTELERAVANGYEATVEELLHPSDSQTMPEDIIRRYHPNQAELRDPWSSSANWIYRMITTRCPLEEKIALFWHGLFATGYSKVNHALEQLNQIGMFRDRGLGSFRELLIELSKDPTMIIWLDNNDNHKGAINENYGRELLELFSMGIGNYTEDDVQEAARAFTGWTLANREYMAMRAMKDSIQPYARIGWHFQYRDDDHDDGEKTFLGETGRFNGEDVIDIIVKQEPTARFVSTRLFQYFAADEVDEEGEDVIQTMMGSYLETGYEVRSVLRTLFNSDYFRSDSARFATMKGPVELIVGAVRMAGSYQVPTLEVDQLAHQAQFMGQGLLLPPNVEGWHEGDEWVDSGALLERVNFAAKELANVSSPGVRAIIDRLASRHEGTLSPQELVDGCLDLMGPIPVSEDTHASLIEFARSKGDLAFGGHTPGDEAEQRVGEMLGLVASTREYQRA